MSEEAAIEAIQAAASSEAAEDQADPFATAQDTPSGEPTPQVQPPVVAQPEGQPVVPTEPLPAQPADENTFDDGQFNPDALPAELQPAWRQLQAAFTQKTQSLAEERKQIEALGDVESLQQAADLYNRISDPSNWAQLHQELSLAMQEYGLTPAEAAQVAAEQIQEAQAPDLSQLVEDPELAPLLQHVQGLQSRLDQFEQTQATARQEQEAEQMHNMLVGELTRQETAIRQSRPDYTDDDVATIYELSSFHNGNLIAAQHAYEEAVSRRISRYFEGKQSSASEPSVQPPSGAGIESVQDDQPETLEDAEAWAIEHIRQRQAAGEEFNI